jgi:hypothetical protein
MRMMSKWIKVGAHPCIKLKLITDFPGVLARGLGCLVMLWGHRTHRFAMPIPNQTYLVYNQNSKPLFKKPPLIPLTP